MLDVIVVNLNDICLNINNTDNEIIGITKLITFYNLKKIKL